MVLFIRIQNLPHFIAQRFRGEWLLDEKNAPNLDVYLGHTVFNRIYERVKVGGEARWICGREKTETERGVGHSRRHP